RSGVTTTRGGCGASGTFGAGGATGREAAGDGKLVISDILGSVFIWISPAFFFAASCVMATTPASFAVDVFVSGALSQSAGGAAIPHTFAGVSSSTPTCWSSRKLAAG